MNDYIPDIVNGCAIANFLTVTPQASDWLYYVQLGLSVLATALMVAYRIWVWKKKALEDNKITDDEIMEVIDIASKGVKEIKETIENDNN